MAEHFFVVGAQRSGTTLLHGLLAAHPEIEMASPVRPEPKFFLLDELHGKGLEHYRRAFFAGKPGARLLGEKTVSYMESDVAARRIADTFPAARVVFLLRDPVERAISHHRFSVAHGVEPLPLEEALEREEERERPDELRRLSMDPWAYVRRGLYAFDVARWARLFPPEQLVLLVYEELIRDPGVLRGLYRRLGVADFDPPRPSAEAPSERAGELLSPGLLQRLAGRFAASNAELAERWRLDVSSWRR